MTTHSTAKHAAPAVVAVVSTVTAAAMGRAKRARRSALIVVCALALVAPVACGKYGKPVRSTGYHTAAPEFATALAPNRLPDPGRKELAKP